MNGLMRHLSTSCSCTKSMVIPVLHSIICLSKIEVVLSCPTLSHDSKCPVEGYHAHSMSSDLNISPLLHAWRPLASCGSQCPRSPWAESEQRSLHRSWAKTGCSKRWRPLATYRYIQHAYESIYIYNYLFICEKKYIYIHVRMYVCNAM